MQNKTNNLKNLLSLDENGHGIVLIDKPTGWTSHDLVNKMRSLTGIKKIGHSGTLDPLATGLLIILIGKKYTRQQDSFLKLNKEYLCTAQLGISTDSYDIDGKITATAPWDKLNKLSDLDVLNKLPSFTGEISQTVPAFSAVKIKGRKLYEIARKGEINLKTLPSRQVTIFKFDLNSFSKDSKEKTIHAVFTIKCSSGTYIRSLIHDLGNFLGVGATVIALRRTKIADFSIEDAHQLEELLEIRK